MSLEERMQRYLEESGQSKAAMSATLISTDLAGVNEQDEVDTELTKKEIYELVLESIYKKYLNDYEEFGIFLSLIDSRGQPVVWSILNFVYYSLVTTGISRAVIGVCGPPSSGKTVTILQASTFLQRAFNPQAEEHSFFEQIRLDLERAYKREVLLPPARSIKIKYVSFDEALERVSLESGQAVSYFEHENWERVNEVIVEMADEHLNHQESDDLVLVFIETPGPGNKDRGVSALRTIAARDKTKVLMVGLMAQESVYELGRDVRLTVQKAQVGDGIKTLVQEKHNVILAGYTDSPEDDQEIKKKFEEACPPMRIEIIKQGTDDYFLALIASVSDDVDRIFKIVEELEVLRLLPENERKVYQQRIVGMYLFLIEVIKVPPHAAIMALNMQIEDGSVVIPRVA